MIAFVKFFDGTVEIYKDISRGCELRIRGLKKNRFIAINNDILNTNTIAKIELIGQNNEKVHD